MNGWREEVMRRDGSCVAARLDANAGPCTDTWGRITETPTLEADYVRHGAKGKRHELASDHVAVCPGHHRGAGATAGAVWATSHRAELRAYLDLLYSTVAA